MRGPLAYLGIDRTPTARESTDSTNFFPLKYTTPLSARSTWIWERCYKVFILFSRRQICTPMLFLQFMPCPSPQPTHRHSLVFFVLGRKELQKTSSLARSSCHKIVHPPSVNKRTWICEWNLWSLGVPQSVSNRWYNEHYNWSQASDNNGVEDRGLFNGCPS